MMESTYDLRNRILSLRQLGRIRCENEWFGNYCGLAGYSFGWHPEFSTFLSKSYFHWKSVRDNPSAWVPVPKWKTRLKSPGPALLITAI